VVPGIGEDTSRGSCIYRASRHQLSKQTHFSRWLMPRFLDDYAPMAPRRFSLSRLSIFSLRGCILFLSRLRPNHKACLHSPRISKSTQPWQERRARVRVRLLNRVRAQRSPPYSSRCRRCSANAATTVGVPALGSVALYCLNISHLCGKRGLVVGNLVQNSRLCSTVAIPPRVSCVSL